MLSSLESSLENRGGLSTLHRRLKIDESSHGKSSFNSAIWEWNFWWLAHMRALQLWMKSILKVQKNVSSNSLANLTETNLLLLLLSPNDQLTFSSLTFNRINVLVYNDIKMSRVSSMGFELTLLTSQEIVRSDWFSEYKASEKNVNPSH